MAKNVDYDRINLEIVQNDTWKQTYSVKKNSTLLDMTGMTLEITVVDEDDVEVLAISTAGMAPAISIVTTSFTINKADAISVVGKYYYDIQLTDLTGVVSTICRGYVKVIKEYTD
jgi:uncharacterized membrane protein YkgB